MRYLINLSYNGNKFYGYQIQNNEVTVEGETEKVLSQILNTTINTVASSRTDRYVHALNQYCHFDYDKEIDTDQLTHSMNSMLDGNIYIKSINKVDDDFHARYSVKYKEYIYKINMGEYNPIDKDYIFQYNKKIKKETLDKFISLVSGKHDYRSFTSDKDKESYERDVTIDYKIEDNILLIRFYSTGFLRYMIRNIVGLLLEINDGKKSLDDIKFIFDSKSRCSIGSPAHGCALYLNKVIY